MKLWFAMVIVPVLDCVALLGPTEYETLPLPVPPLLGARAIQVALLAAVHVQLLAHVTATLPACADAS